MINKKYGDGQCRTYILLVVGLLAALFVFMTHLKVSTRPPYIPIISGFTPSAKHWLDTQGNRIEAHAAGMLHDEKSDMWYWYGESTKTEGNFDHGINCYSSKSLGGPWKFEGQIISQTDIPVPTADRQGPFVVERPKVLYNDKTRKYVCWLHLDDERYLMRHAAVFEANNPTGPFRFIHAIQPDGLPSLDMSLFKDPVTHQAYFVRSVDNKYTGISKLTDDYHDSLGMISKMRLCEGMAIFRHPNGTYYMISSHLTGWNPNPLILFRARGKTLDDPQWLDMGNPTAHHTSFNSQPTYVVQHKTKHGKPYFIYMADNWVHGGPNGLIDAAYIWLPFEFQKDKVKLKYQHEWDLNDPFRYHVGKSFRATDGRVISNRVQNSVQQQINAQEK